MKKKFYTSLIIMLSFFVISCSNDDGTTVSISNTINKIEEKVYYNGQIDSQYIMNFNYNDAVLESVSNDVYRLDFVYNGDKITELKRFVNDQYTDSNLINYENNYLKTITQDNQDEQTSYSYQNGVLNSKTISYMDNGSMVNYSTEIYQFSSNNIIQTIYENQFSTTPTKRTFEFDTKNNMFKNMNKYLKYIIEFETIDILSQNNQIKVYNYSSFNSSQGVLAGEFIITYDDENYPVSIKKYSINNNQPELVSELLISYN